jgi:predicted TPR repeat methyltransferase
MRGHFSLPRQCGTGSSVRAFKQDIKSVDAYAASSGDLIADRRYRFGCDLAARGDFSAAADLFAQAAEAAPGFAPAWFGLGEARERLGDAAGAASAYRQALDIDPDDRCGAALHLARLGGVDAASAMSPAYVRALFDQYAPRFDAALAGLAYRGPARLREAVENIRPGITFDRMLDLGCGTGLAGAAFRPLARHIVGVDLSPAMIAQARAKQIYDRLETGDLLQFLADEKDKYELAIAADVFVYLFDLAPIAVAVARALRPRGLFGFTVETYAGTGVELGEKLRFRHGAEHVRDAVAAAGLRLFALSPAATRTEAGADVPGLLAVAMRSDDDTALLPR